MMATCALQGHEEPAIRPSLQFGRVDVAEDRRNRVQKIVRNGGDDLGLGKAEARMVAVEPKLSSGGASRNSNFRAVRRANKLLNIYNKTQRNSEIVQNRKKWQF